MLLRGGVLNAQGRLYLYTGLYWVTSQPQKLSQRGRACIRKVPCSNLGEDTDYPEVFRDNTRLGQDRLLPNPF
jgi:hypothetical protein